MKNSTDYKYKGKLEPVHVVIFKFHNAPNYILSVGQYKDMGKYQGVIKSHGFSIRDIEGVEYGTMCPIDFNSLQAWEG